MKITGKSHSTATFPGNYITSKAQNPQPHPDLKTSLKPRRRTRNPSLTRSKRTGTPLGRRSRPETPFLKWKIEDRERNVRVEEHEDELEEKLETCARKGRRKITRAVSARKLAAGLWRLQLPETMAAGTGERRRRDQLGFQPGAGHVGISFLPHHSGKVNGSEVQDPSQRPSSVSGMKKIFLCKLEPSLQFSNSAMEGATKWDPVCLETLDEVRQSYGHLKRLDQQVSAVSVVSALEAELEHARTHIQELEAERRKNRQRLEIVNSKLVNELADAKVSAKRFMLDYEKERKARELVEEVCDELAKEIGEDKAEVEALKRESLKLQEEVNEERKMLQMAEVWREERVQMKLVDAKVLLEEKYSQMNRLVADLENFLRSRSAAPDLKEMREVESLVHAAASVNIQDIKDFTYEPPNPDDIFSVFEEFNSGDPNEREIEQCVAYSPASHAAKIHTVSPEVNLINKDGSHRHSDAFVDQNGDIEEDESGWETVSHLEDQGSSYSPEGSIPSVNRNRRDSNVSASGTDWEENAFDETPLTEISELCSVPTRQLKKVSSIAKLWRSCPNNGITTI
ncbi:hypothetical protein GH714_012286 [Hevea brasiliensis]|uniref:Uncharacterized protein n=1 Tax=Hevea brasiliensis TaxID=3981 RepID=A0A6A6KIL0_HEVBR|nr:hypothetical protein GH714_012286 [Hevea brasiliensis]